MTADGDRVDTGTADVDGNVVTIPLRGDLPDDGYLVTYRVVSADSHPISGAFSFVVGDGELVSAGAAAGDASVDDAIAALLPGSRWIGFGGMALAIGIPVLALVCWPGRLGEHAAAPAGRRGHRRRRRVLASARSCCRARTRPDPG